MDDEEVDMSRPVSQHWGTPFGDSKYERTSIGDGGGPASVPPPASQNNGGLHVVADDDGDDHGDSQPCGAHRRTLALPHGSSVFRPRLPTRFEPTEDRGERRIEGEEGGDEEENRMAERPAEPDEMSVEVQIGRKLRVIGDQFHRDHVELFQRHQREQIPAWMRLTMALFGFLFPREALVPHRRGEMR